MSLSLKFSMFVYNIFSGDKLLRGKGTKDFLNPIVQVRLEEGDKLLYDEDLVQ